MSTKGAVKIKNAYYCITSDAYPSYAQKLLFKAVKISKTPREFVSNANKLAGHKWINGSLNISWVKSPHCEYLYEVNLHTKKVRKVRMKYDVKNKKNIIYW